MAAKDAMLLWALVWVCLAVPSAADVCQSCRNNACRRVTGIFTRANLPLGYNLIARVPPRSCNLTVTEASHSSNFLAIRTEGGYIINGNWAVLPSGRYMGAGTGFYYTHPRPQNDVGVGEGEGEVIQAPGPFTATVDIMIIYQSANKGVRYEYWHPLRAPVTPVTPTLPQGPGGRGRGNMARHRGSHRGPGGGDPLHDVQAAYLAPPTRPDASRVGVVGTVGVVGSMGVVGGASSPASYAPESRLSPAGSATQGVVGGVGGSGGAGGVGGSGMGVSGSAGVFDGVGGGEMGVSGRGGMDTARSNATPSWKVWKFTPCSKTCGGGQQEAVYICTGPGGSVLTEDQCPAPKPPPQTVHCNPRPCPPEWQLGEWTQCSVTCGTGLMTRTWACIQEVTPTLTRAVPPGACPSPAHHPMVPLTQPCTLAPCTRWEVTAWNKCSAECGTGVVRRQVSCRADGRRVSDEQCNVQERPPTQQLCHGHSCTTHTWFYTDWSEECTGGCEDGVQVRRVWCAPGVNAVEGDCDQSQRPPETRPCARADACAAAWFTGPWMPCSRECGNGTSTREVVCVVFLSGTFRATLDIECNANTRPHATQACNPHACLPHWYYTDWSPCSRTCGRGASTRAVQCLDQDQRPSTRCVLADKPSITRPCSGPPCTNPAGNKYTDRNCADHFRNCKLVQQARLCRYSYYRTVCCASCILA